MSMKPLESEKTYPVELNYNEIHIILNSLDEFVENHPHLADIKAIASVQDKLEPLHWKHTKTVRDKLLNRE